MAIFACLFINYWHKYLLNNEKKEKKIIIKFWQEFALKFDDVSFSFTSPRRNTIYIYIYKQKNTYLPIPLFIPQSCSPTHSYHSSDQKFCPIVLNNYKFSTFSKKCEIDATRIPSYPPPHRKTRFVFHHGILTPGEQCTCEGTNGRKEIPIRIRNETSC